MSIDLTYYRTIVLFIARLVLAAILFKAGINKLPVSASNLYAKNVFNFISNLYDKENKKLNVNLEDEIIEKTLIK